MILWVISLSKDRSLADPLEIGLTLAVESLPLEHYHDHRIEPNRVNPVLIHGIRGLQNILARWKNKSVDPGHQVRTRTPGVG